MFKVDPTALQSLALTTPATTMRVDSAVDHPGTWLEMLEVLPCQDENNGCLYAEFGSGQKIAARVVDLAKPVIDAEALCGSRRFGLQLVEGEITCGARVEFNIKATADHLNLTLALLSADEVLLNTPLLATGLALTLPNILKAAAHDVVAVVHHALSPDLAETTVSFNLVMPNAKYTELLAESMSELTLQMSESIGRLPMAYTGVLADAPVAPASRVESARTKLSTAQRLALAVNLIALREARDMKQLEVAHKALGFSKSHAAVSRLERGILSDVETDRLERLASFFDTDVASLLGNDATSGAPTQPGEGEGPSIFDPNCAFTPSVNFGRRITLARTSAGLSTTALAKALGHVCDNTVKEWEAEGSPPRRTSFIDLGLALDTPVSWLMFGRRVETPSRGLALRLTAMQKRYGLTNGEVAALMQSTNDPDILLSTTKLVGRLSRARHATTVEHTRRLATAFQVPADWISPPDAEIAQTIEYPEPVRTPEIPVVVDETAQKLRGLSKSARKLVTDIIDLIEMGVVTDNNIRDMRSEMVTKYTTPYIRRRTPAAPQDAMAS